MWPVESRAVAVRTGSMVQISPPRLVIDRNHVAGSHMPLLSPWLTIGLMPT
jgi:hypothetical protein